MASFARAETRAGEARGRDDAREISQCRHTEGLMPGRDSAATCPVKQTRAAEIGARQTPLCQKVPKALFRELDFASALLCFHVHFSTGKQFHENI